VTKPFSESKGEQGGTRLVGRRKAEAAAAVEALLVGASRVTGVSAADITAACKSLKVDSARQIRKECKVLYGRYLDYCFEDKMLSSEENADLAHLQQILQLSDADVSVVQDDVSVAVYGRAVTEVLEDMRIDSDEADFLRRLREELQLSDTKAQRILDDGTRDARGRALREASSSDDTFADRREPAGDFTGRSAAGLEAAVNDALGKANLAIPQLQWFEVTQISGYVENGSASQWYVILQAGIDPGDR
jgi:flavin-binding protein dodecin